MTLVLAAHHQAGIFVALDPQLYDPLPMGISIEFKDRDVERTLKTSWNVWERETRSGNRRHEPRAPATYETIVGFTPDRLLDFAEFERSAHALDLDPALRFAAAKKAAKGRGQPSRRRHEMETLLGLQSDEVFDLITHRSRLKTALFGGVAEVHLQRHLDADPDVADVRHIDEDAKPDFSVDVVSRGTFLIECKNVSPKAPRDGDFKVDLQKTRHSKDDPSTRFYKPSQFDVVAVCLFSPTGKWDYLFRATQQLRRHDKYPDRLAANQVIRRDEWHERVVDALPTRRRRPGS